MEHRNGDENGRLLRPNAARVAERALVLTAIASRGSLEGSDRNSETIEFWRAVSDWFDSLRLDSELEPQERHLLRTPFGRLERKEAIDAGWRSEGLGVLAWALGRYQLPSHDELVDPRAAADSVGFLRPREETALISGRLRSADELVAYSESMFSIHWRLREFSVRPRPIDFVEFARGTGFGPLSLDGIRLAGNDLAIGRAPIGQATRDEVHHVQSIARERHQAANWLIGVDTLYSRVDTST